MAEAMTYVTNKGRDRLDELGVTDDGLPEVPPPPEKMRRVKRYFRGLFRRLGLHKYDLETFPFKSLV